MKFTVPKKSFIHVERHNENKMIFACLTLGFWRGFLLLLFLVWHLNGYVIYLGFF